MGKFILTVEMSSEMEEIITGFKTWENKIIKNQEIEIIFNKYNKKDKGKKVSPKELEGIDALIFHSSRKINKNSLNKANKLKWIGRFGSGYENVNISACTNAGVMVSNSPEPLWESVAEVIVGYMIALSIKLTTFNSWIRGHGFKNKEKYMTDRLYKKSLGIIGFGGIGSRVCELVQPFEMEVLVYDPYVEEHKIRQKGAEPVLLDYLLSHSDFISLNVPLTKETKGMLRKNDFKKMKNTAYLINTCRGGIYKDAELAEALEQGWLKGAAVDVFENEPDISGNPLLKLDNDQIILAPHIAGARHNMDAIKKIADIFIESVLKVKNGKLPENIINPDAVKTHIPDEKRTPSF
ncbi:MAG: NAD(P)-dependent oxidoreductase [bacterium]